MKGQLRSRQKEPGLERVRPTLGARVSWPEQGSEGPRSLWGARLWKGLCTSTVQKVLCHGT